MDTYSIHVNVKLSGCIISVTIFTQTDHMVSSLVAASYITVINMMSVTEVITPV